MKHWGVAMGIPLSQAKKLAEEARIAVGKSTLARDEARATFEAAQDALEASKKKRLDTKAVIEDLQAKLKTTREAIMPNEAASKRAHLELTATQEALNKAHGERVEAEKRLSELEEKRDRAEALLTGAEQNVERTGENEVCSRATLDERVQRATDAQRALDAAIKAVEQGKEDVERAQKRLDKARSAEAALPNDNDPLNREVARKQDALQRAIASSKEAAAVLEEKRVARATAESAALTAKETYEQAQNNLRTAIAAADRADGMIREMQRQAGVDEGDKAMLARLRSDYAAAQDVRSAAMVINARALTELADADVEAIRLRIACEEAASVLDASNASRARAERELREAVEAVERSNDNRKATRSIVEAQEMRLKEAQENLARLKQANEEAVQNNAAAQADLRDMQEQAVEYGQKSREAADTLDGRRHELSDIVSWIEYERNQLFMLKEHEEQCAANVDAAYAVNQEADQALEKARSFIVEAEGEIARLKKVVADTERQTQELGAVFRSADEAYSTAQRNLDVANADLTNAEVSVIMAEIDERL